MKIIELGNNPSEEQLMARFEEMSANDNVPVIKTWRRLAGISRKKRRLLHKITTRRTSIMIDEFSSLGSTKNFRDFFTNSYKRSSKHE